MKYFFKTLTLAVLVSLVASLFLLSFKAEEPQDSAPVLVETQQITDNLSNPEEIKEYPVTVAEKGDLMITLAGLQERWDGYTYHWHATLFAEDKTTVITKESVRGYCGIEGYATTLSLPDMEAGTYYLQMTSVAYQNPLMATFTDASYQISITPFYHSVPETPASVPVLGFVLLRLHPYSEGARYPYLWQHLPEKACAVPHQQRLPCPVY